MKLTKVPALIEALPSHPARDLVVAFAGIAGAPRGNHVGEGVSATTRDCENAVALQRIAWLLALGTLKPDALFNASR